MVGLNHHLLRRVKNELIIRGVRGEGEEKGEGEEGKRDETVTITWKLENHMSLTLLKDL